MTTFTMIIMILFMCALVTQFAAAIERDCLGLAMIFGFEIIAFAYFAKVLM